MGTLRKPRRVPNNRSSPFPLIKTSHFLDQVQGDEDESMKMAVKLKVWFTARYSVNSPCLIRLRLLQFEVVDVSSSDGASCHRNQTKPRAWARCKVM